MILLHFIVFLPLIGQALNDIWIYQMASNVLNIIIVTKMVSVHESRKIKIAVLAPKKTWKINSRAFKLRYLLELEKKTS